MPRAGAERLRALQKKNKEKSVATPPVKKRIVKLIHPEPLPVSTSSVSTLSEEDVKIEETKARIRDILIKTKQSMSVGGVFKVLVDGEDYDGKNSEHRFKYKTVKLFLTELDKQGLVDAGKVWNISRTKSWFVYTWVGPKGRAIGKKEAQAIVSSGVEYGEETKKTAVFILTSVGNKSVFRDVIRDKVNNGIGASAALRVDAALSLLEDGGLIIEEYPDEYRKTNKSDEEARKILNEWEVSLSVPVSDKDKEDRIFISSLDPDAKDGVEFIMGKLQHMIFAKSAKKVYDNEVEKHGPKWKQRWERRE